MAQEAAPVFDRFLDPTDTPIEKDRSLADKLNRARTGLLDLSARNRLLNTPRTGKTLRTVEVVDEKSAEIYRLLVAEERVFTFAAGREAARSASDGGMETSSANSEPLDSSDEIADLAQPEDDAVDARGVHLRHADTVLQTRLTSAGLQKRLLEMYSDAITLEQEQGVNILYLALGMLRWIDPKNAKSVRFAPLVLVPVSLERSSASERFRLRWRHEEVASNLSLEAYLDREHKLRLPEFEASEDLNLPAYYEAVRECVSQKAEWQVFADDVVLGFFSFAKFLMYRDLDPECWPAEVSLSSRPLIRALLQEGFEATAPAFPDALLLDQFLAPADMLHVTDADSSQARAIAEARAGRSLVIQGPPGTGKSQTIANIIGAAVADGKTVLLVAEKMVALSVVKSRLDRAGVGDACLELHSNKANKKALLQELRRTWELGTPHANGQDSLNENLLRTRNTLNDHAAVMHTMHPVARLTPFEVTGNIAELLRTGERPVDFTLEQAIQWTPDAARERRDQVCELAERVRDMGLPQQHPWRGVGALRLLPTDVERLMEQVAQVQGQLAAFVEGAANLAQTLDRSPILQLRELDTLCELARRVSTAPPLSSEALGSPEWENPTAAESLLTLGERHRQLRDACTATFQASALHADIAADTELLTQQPPELRNDVLDQLAFLPELRRNVLRRVFVRNVGRAVERLAPVRLANGTAGHDPASRIGQLESVLVDVQPVGGDLVEVKPKNGHVSQSVEEQIGRQIVRIRDDE